MCVLGNLAFNVTTIFVSLHRTGAFFMTWKQRGNYVSNILIVLLPHVISNGSVHLLAS